MRYFYTLAILAIVMLGAVNLHADSKRKVLVEEFVNTYTEQTATSNAVFTPWLADRQGNVIPIRYHFATTPDNDPFNEHNPEMVMSRLQSHVALLPTNDQGQKTFYITQTIVNGTYGGAAIVGEMLTATQNEITARTGKMSPIDLTVAIEKAPDGRFKVTTNIKSSKAFPDAKVYIVLGEYHVEGLPNGQGSNGEDEFWWVARKMLPSNDGAPIIIEANSENAYEYYSAIHEDWNEEEMYAVAFVQDTKTKEVYQAAVSKDFYTIEAKAQASLFNTVQPGSSVTIPIELTNPIKEAIEVELVVNENVFVKFTDLSEHTISVSETKFDINLLMKKTFNVTISVPENMTGFTIFRVEVKVKTKNPDSERIISGTTFDFYTMAGNVEAVNYVFGNPAISYYSVPTYGSLLSTELYQGKAALVPARVEGVLEAFPATNYELAVISANTNGSLAIYNNERFFNNLQHWVNSGVDILFESEAYDFLIYDKNQNTGAFIAPEKYRTFFENTFGVQPAQLLPLINNNQLQQLPINGYANDIMKGVLYRINASYDAEKWPYINNYAHLLTIMPDRDDVTPILNVMDEQETKYPIGVRVERSKDQRLIYLGFGTYGEGQQMRYAAFNTMVNWLKDNMPEPTPAEISTNLPIGKLNFGKAENQIAKSFTIKNDGEADLVVSKIYLSENEESVFSIIEGGKSVTLGQGETHEINVRFKPKDNVKYTGTIVIESNASNKPKLEIGINGEGIGFASVSDGIAQINGSFSMQAGPNPFATETNVTYTIETNTPLQVNMTLVDMTGKELMTLVNEVKGAGTHQVKLSSNELNSGTYFIRAGVDGRVIQLPVVIVK